MDLEASKQNKYMMIKTMSIRKKIILALAIVVFIPGMALGASEIGGYLNTGIDTGFDAGVATEPVATPVVGTYTTAQNVTLTTEGNNHNSIRYTTDGSNPACPSTGTL